MKKIKGFTGSKTIGGELLKFKKGYTTIDGVKYTVKQINEAMAIQEDVEYPKAMGW